MYWLKLGRPALAMGRQDGQWNNRDHGTLVMNRGLEKNITFKNKPILGIVFCLLTLIIFGLRFSDGSMLLTISQGADTGNDVFKNPLTQYVWDSPLKVSFLRLLPADIIVIAVVFLIMSGLPVVLAFLGTKEIASAASISLLFTPILKISFQNVGLGDGLIVSLAIIMMYSNSGILSLIATVLICTWHPQQSFFIIGSYFAAVHSLNRIDSNMVRLKFLMVGSVIGFSIYVVYIVGFAPSFSGRASYMARYIEKGFLDNVLYIIVAILPILIWAKLSNLSLQNSRNWIVWLWIVVCIIVAMLTTDFTRIITLTTFPIVIVRTKDLLINNEIGASALWFYVPIIFMIPPYSWSGIDISVWGDLFKDMCEWGLVCF